MASICLKMQNNAGDEDEEEEDGVGGADQVGGDEDDKVGCDLFPLVDQLFKESKVSQYRCTHHIPIPPRKMISTVSPYVTMRSQCQRWCCGEGKPRCGQSQEQVQYSSQPRSFN